MEITVKNLLDWVMKGIVFIVIVTVVFGAGAFVYTKYFVPETYVSVVKFYALGNDKRSISGEKVAPQYVEFLNVNEFYEMVSKDLFEDTGREYAPSAIAGSISFSRIIEDTSSFYVSVTSTDPNLSYNLALSIADQAPVRIAEFEEGEMLKISSHPVLPTRPSGPNISRNTLLGVMIGLVLGVAAVIIRELLDSRIKTADEITELFGLPVFGVVPDFSAGDNKKGANQA